MKGLIGIGLAVTGVMAVLKVIGLLSLLFGGTTRPAFFIIEQVVYALGCAAAFVGLWVKNKQLDAADKADEIAQTRADQGNGPPPPAV